MISIVFCSIHPERAKIMQRHYEFMLGNEPHEIIVITDALSLAEAFNRALDQAKGEIVILSHDDIEFLKPSDWLSKIKLYLNNYDLIGLAGTTKLIGPAWASAGPPNTFGQVAELNSTDDHPYRVLILGTHAPIIPNIQAVDGLFMAFNKNITKNIRFDAINFDGFHCYDIDFSFRLHLAGYRLGVATDIPVIHSSQGKFSDSWKTYAYRFIDKHELNLSKRRHRPCQHAMVMALTKDEILEIMGHT